MKKQVSYTFNLPDDQDRLEAFESALLYRQEWKAFQFFLFSKPNLTVEETRTYFKQVNEKLELV